MTASYEAIDSNRNFITVNLVNDQTYEGKPLWNVQVHSNLYGNKTEAGDGYIAVQDTHDAAFGDEKCPSSYGMNCLTWYGPGERYSSAQEALDALKTDSLIRD